MNCKAMGVMHGRGFQRGGTIVTTLDAGGVWTPISRTHYWHPIGYPVSRGMSFEVIELQSVSWTLVSPTSANADGVDIPLGIHHSA
jgi:hypothetical protein